MRNEDKERAKKYALERARNSRNLAPCHKISFGSATAAKQMLSKYCRFEERFRTDGYVYMCLYCPYWHISTNGGGKAHWEKIAEDAIKAEKKKYQKRNKYYSGTTRGNRMAIKRLKESFKYELDDEDEMYG